MERERADINATTQHQSWWGSSNDKTEDTAAHTPPYAKHTRARIHKEKTARKSSSTKTDKKKRKKNVQKREDDKQRDSAMEGRPRGKDDEARAGTVAHLAAVRRG